MQLPWIVWPVFPPPTTGVGEGGAKDLGPRARRGPTVQTIPDGYDPRHVIRPAQAGTHRDREHGLQPVASCVRVLHVLK